MKSPALIIVADCGRMLAFTVESSADEPSLSPIEVTNVLQDQGKLSEQVTKQAEPVAAGSGGVNASSAERMKLVSELRMRTSRRISGRMNFLLEEYHPETWGFAAPADINSTILAALDYEWQEKLRGNLSVDLIDAPQREIMAHFSHGVVSA